MTHLLQPLPVKIPVKCLAGGVTFLVCITVKPYTPVVQCIVLYCKEDLSVILSVIQLINHFLTVQLTCSGYGEKGFKKLGKLGITSLKDLYRSLYMRTINRRSHATFRLVIIKTIGTPPLLRAMTSLRFLRLQSEISFYNISTLVKYSAKTASSLSGKKQNKNKNNPAF